MPIREHPAIGTVLMCDFETGFRPPEMVKKRQVVVISPKIAARAGLCTVVPLSTTPPHPAMQYHCRIDLPDQLPGWMEKKDVWVKADMMFAASFSRLDLIRLGKSQAGRRAYCYTPVSDGNLRKIRKAVLASLGLAQLTKAL